MRVGQRPGLAYAHGDQTREMSCSLHSHEGCFSLADDKSVCLHVRCVPFCRVRAAMLLICLPVAATRCASGVLLSPATVLAAPPVHSLFLPVHAHSMRPCNCGGETQPTFRLQRGQRTVTIEPRDASCSPFCSVIE